MEKPENRRYSGLDWSARGLVKNGQKWSKIVKNSQIVREVVKIDSEKIPMYS